MSATFEPPSRCCRSPHPHRHTPPKGRRRRLARRLAQRWRRSCKASPHLRPPQRSCAVGESAQTHPQQPAGTPSAAAASPPAVPSPCSQVLRPDLASALGSQVLALAAEAGWREAHSQRGSGGWLTGLCTRPQSIQGSARRSSQIRQRVLQQPACTSAAALPPRALLQGAVWLLSRGGAKARSLQIRSWSATPFWGCK